VSRLNLNSFSTVTLTMSSYDMYKDIEEKLASKQGTPYTDEFLCGLPIGLELPNGITIGAHGARVNPLTRTSKK
jgi:hypothetical protein